MITMTADFRKRHRRLMTVSSNRGENKIIHRERAFFNQLKPGLPGLSNSNRDARGWFPRSTHNARFEICDRSISQARTTSTALVSFASEMNGNIL